MSFFVSYSRGVDSFSLSEFTNDCPERSPLSVFVCFVKFDFLLSLPFFRDHFI